MAQITIRLIHNDFSKNLTCLTISHLTDPPIPSKAFPQDSIKIPSHLRLADPKFHLPRPVDLLIRSGATLLMLSIGQINLSNDEHDLYLQKTCLGWVVAGGMKLQMPSCPDTCGLTTLETQLEKF